MWFEFTISAFLMHSRSLIIKIKFSFQTGSCSNYAPITFLKELKANAFSFRWGVFPAECSALWDLDLLISLRRFALGPACRGRWAFGTGTADSINSDFTIRENLRGPGSQFRTAPRIQSRRSVAKKKLQYYSENIKKCISNVRKQANIHFEV